jgi:hypothetical protein
VPLLLGAFTALMIGVTLLVAARRPRLAGRHSLPRRGEK